MLIGAGWTAPYPARCVFLSPARRRGRIQRALSMVRYLPEEGLMPTVLTGPPRRGTVGAVGRIAEHRFPDQASGPSARRAGADAKREVAESDGAVAVTFRSRSRRGGCRCDRGARRARRDDRALGPRDDVAVRERGGGAPPRGAPRAFRGSLISGTRGRSTRCRSIRARSTAESSCVRMERLLSSASAIVMNTPEATVRPSHRVPATARIPVVTVTNGFDAVDFTGPAPVGDRCPFRIVHTGYLHTDAGRRSRARSQRLLGGAPSDVDILTRSHTYLLDALERWFARRPEVRGDVELVLAGSTTRGGPQESSRGLRRDGGPLPRVRLARGERRAREGRRPALPPDAQSPAGRSITNRPGEDVRVHGLRPSDSRGGARRRRQRLPREMRSCVGVSTRRRRGDDRVLEIVYEGWKSREPVLRSDDVYVARFERRRLAAELAATLAELLPDGTTPRDAATHQPGTEIARVRSETDGRGATDVSGRAP